jgi:hypothetical protein
LSLLVLRSLSMGLLKSLVYSLNLHGIPWRSETQFEPLFRSNKCCCCWCCLATTKRPSRTLVVEPPRLRGLIIIVSQSAKTGAIRTPHDERVPWLVLASVRLAPPSFNGEGRGHGRRADANDGPSKPRKIRIPPPLVQ